MNIKDNKKSKNNKEKLKLFFKNNKEVKKNENIDGKLNKGSDNRSN